jgi:hexosaminidase
MMLATLLCLAAAAPGQYLPDLRHSLLPVPASLTWGDGRFRVDRSLGVIIEGAPGDRRLARAASRFELRVAAQTGLLPPASLRLTIHAAGPGQSVQALAENEQYTLEISPAGARLEAATTIGIIRGLETILQLLASDSAGWFLPAVRIDDAPRFPWRGLLIDVARHWQPAEVIKRQLDGMAAVKLNVLHWHLSDDQGFRVESRRFPRLHGLGSDGDYYTQEQIREIVAYAHDRGIRVVPEFDLPGHSTAWFVGYPQYASAPGPYAIERRFGVFAPTFDPTRESTYRFLDSFLAEMTPLFPDQYWHIGGDEVVGSAWRNSAGIRTFMRTRKLADNAALQAYFNQRMSKLLTAHGKRMAGWDEILHADLPTSTLIQSWRGQRSLGEGAGQGYRGILSAGWYLDHMRTAEFHYLVDPLPENHLLTPAEVDRVLGGEACMWGEHLSPESIDSRIWPRLGAIAERLWSRREVRDVPDMYRRLDFLRERLTGLGLGHEGHTLRMAQSLTGLGDGQTLSRFLGLTEPIRFGERVSAQKLTQQVPLVFAVDAARPDPPAQWATRVLVTRALERDTEARRTLELAFEEWGTLAREVGRLALSAVSVVGVAEASAALSRVAAIGQGALTELDRGVPESEWSRQTLAELDLLAKPQGLLRITVIPAVRKLVEGVGGR